jgi:hypothetical protein
MENNASIGLQRFLNHSHGCFFGATYGVLNTGSQPPGQRDSTGGVARHNWHNRHHARFSLVPSIPAARILRGVLYWCLRGVQFLLGTDCDGVFYARNSRVHSHLLDLEGVRVGLALELNPSNRRVGAGWFWCADRCFNQRAADRNLRTNHNLP